MSKVCLITGKRKRVKSQFPPISPNDRSFAPFFFFFNLLRMVCLLHLELLTVHPQRFTRSRKGSWQR